MATFEEFMKVAEISLKDSTHYVLKGGRGSTKSSFTSIEIILGVMQHPDAHAVILRKVGNTLHDSVFTQRLWAVQALGVQEYFRPNQSPLRLAYAPTGQTIPVSYTHLGQAGLLCDPNDCSAWAPL